jgi:hypothetical protein
MQAVEAVMLTLSHLLPVGHILQFFIEGVSWKVPVKHPSSARSGDGHAFPAVHATHVLLPSWLVLPAEHASIVLFFIFGHLNPDGHGKHLVKPYPE